MPAPVLTTLVTGRRAFDRETAIAARLPAVAAGGMSTVAAGGMSTVAAGGTPAVEIPTLATAPGGASASASASASTAPERAVVIIEGLAEPNSPLADAAHVQLLRIAPGCLCCAGNLVLRVTLNRLLRRPPAQLFISLADATHVGQLRAMLSAPPYDTLLSLCDDLAAPPSHPE